MQCETLVNGGEVPVLGLGTWQVGGSMSPDYSRDGKIVEILRAAIELGYTHIDTAEMYAGGHTEELVGRAIQNFKRERLFITSKVWHTNLHYQGVLNACSGSLKRLGIDYLDLYLIHWPNSGVPLEETFRALNELVDQGQVRHLGVSNFNLKLLEQAQTLAHTPLATNQVPYSLSQRQYVQNGVLDYCQANGILLTAYTPIEKGMVSRNRVVKRIADKNGATPVQVALHWLVRQPKVIAIPMSTNLRHLEENLHTMDLELSGSDIEELNRLA